MWWHKKPSPKNLEEWLEIATKGIVPLEAEAIAREIKSHYQDELEFQMSYGKTQVEAEKIALIDLRNAYKANNKFCQTHITLQDSDMLRIRSSTELLWFLGLSFCVVLYGFFTGHYFFIVMLLFRFIEGVSKFIQSYFVSIGKAMFGLKVTQRLNLLVYPLGVCSVLFGWIFALGGLLEWQIYAGFFLLVFLTYEYFLTIKTQNDTIQKFKRYLLEHPQVSQTKPQHR